MRVVLDMSQEEIEKAHEQKFDYVKRWREAGAYVFHDGGAPAETKDATAEERELWDKFMSRYRGEIEELTTNYGDIDLLWFDVMLTKRGLSWESEDVKQMINTINPKTVVNARLGESGDYETPECYVPLRALNKPWELCITFNESWGYQPHDKKYKSLRQVVRIFVECISKGGNMLISAGPTAEGDIPPEQEKLMLGLGEWIHNYAEAIYPTQQGIPTEYFLGGSTMTEDQKTLYLFAYDKPQDKIMLNGVRNKIKKITALKTNMELSYMLFGGAPWLNIPGCYWIDVPEAATDDICTVIKIEFEETLDLVDLESVVKSSGGY